MHSELSKSSSIYINIHRIVVKSNKFTFGLLTYHRPKCHCATLCGLTSKQTCYRNRRDSIALHLKLN